MVLLEMFRWYYYELKLSNRFFYGIEVNRFLNLWFFILIKDFFGELVLFFYLKKSWYCFMMKIIS